MSLRIALLGLLDAKGPASGYDLAKAFERSLNHVWQAGHTQIYPELVKMADDGLVEVESEGARGRKIYAITREGTAWLHEWLVGHDPSTVVRSEAALKAFLLTLLGPGEAIEVVTQIKAHAQARLTGLECLGTPASEAFTGRFALDLGRRQAQAMIDWANATLATLEGRRVPGASQGA
ncbi:DNA-binding PadR family transcriptional regulator [Nonomuraea thailandensis]|uniref:DNA-binding PadR family transcriptional regulator n=1 Tax=Nonomuraea thailandensis TaxID=1188745 RepID=A0A9X2GPK3_9ACTN|nr:PadR family transcriptional regulator [Nonomuraea thailandensis]MCP2358488.1 DNA-binding PadR family transcriptional regulator [Nonomuraea thailandensis]